MKILKATNLCVVQIILVPLLIIGCSSTRSKRDSEVCSDAMGFYMETIDRSDNLFDSINTIKIGKKDLKVKYTEIKIDSMRSVFVDSLEFESFWEFESKCNLMVRNVDIYLDKNSHELKYKGNNGDIANRVITMELVLLIRSSLNYVYDWKHKWVPETMVLRREKSVISESARINTCYYLTNDVNPLICNTNGSID